MTYNECPIGMTAYTYTVRSEGACAHLSVARIMCKRLGNSEEHAAFPVDILQPSEYKLLAT